MLDALLILDGERLSYRALDVEQVGSVYEAMMGYEVERAFGQSIAVRPKHIVISVDELLEEDGGKRKKWLNDKADSELTGASATALKDAGTSNFSFITRPTFRGRPSRKPNSSGLKSWP